MDKPAFPMPIAGCTDGSVYNTMEQSAGQLGGMTLREHAALTLRVPDSGDERIDAMIRQANRRDAAVAAMQGLLANSKVAPEDFTKHGMDRFYVTVAHDCIKHADALIAKLEETK